MTYRQMVTLHGPAHDTHDLLPDDELCAVLLTTRMTYRQMVTLHYSAHNTHDYYHRHCHPSTCVVVLTPHVTFPDGDILHGYAHESHDLLPDDALCTALLTTKTSLDRYPHHYY